GLVLIGAGLVVFRYSADIAGQLDSYISPPPDTGSNMTGLVSTGGWYLPFAVWGFGFTLIGLGGTMLRSAFMSAAMGGGGGPMGGRGGNVARRSRHIHAAGSLRHPRGNQHAGSQSGAAEGSGEVKCRNCGNLEMEDAAFCRKCGKPL